MDDKIILIIENETPLRSDALGELFMAFAWDYRELTHGRTLVVAHLGQGSTLIEWTDFILTTAGHYLKEAGEAAKAVKGLADFAALVKSLFGKKRDKPARQVTRRRKKTGDRSAEALAEIAAENRCRVRFRRTTAQGETLEFELTPTEALEFQQQIHIEEQSSREAEKLQFPTALERSGNSKVLPALVTSIRQLVQPRDGSTGPVEIDQIAEALVGILENSGLSHLVEEIAARFEAEGLLQIASALRHKMQRSSGNHEPLLLTT